MVDSKYRTLVQTLKTNILSGKYGNGNPFPSVRALIKRYGLSNTTVLHAMDELVRQGLISRKQGRGTFVSSSGSSRKIGLIIPGVAYSEFFPPIVSEISRLSQPNDYTLLFGDVAAKTPEKRAVMARKLAREFVAQQVSGVLYQPIEMLDDAESVNREILSVFGRAKVPVVIIDNDFSAYAHRKDFDVVGIDNVAAGAMVAEHLLERGVRRISFQKRPKCSASVHVRHRGVVSALALAGGKAAVPNWWRTLVTWPPSGDICGSIVRRPLSAVTTRRPWS